MKHRINIRLVFAVLISIMFAMLALLIVSHIGAGMPNKQLFDTNFRYNYAEIKLPSGRVVSGKVQTWTDYDDGDQIQVKIDGVVYLVHSSNVALIYE